MFVHCRNTPGLLGRDESCALPFSSCESVLGYTAARVDTWGEPCQTQPCSGDRSLRHSMEMPETKQSPELRRRCCFDVKHTQRRDAWGSIVPFCLGVTEANSIHFIRVYPATRAVVVVTKRLIFDTIVYCSCDVFGQVNGNRTGHGHSGKLGSKRVSIARTIIKR